MEKRRALRQIFSFFFFEFIYPFIWFPVTMVNREFIRLLGIYTTCYLAFFLLYFYKRNRILYLYASIEIFKQITWLMSQSHLVVGFWTRSQDFWFLVQPSQCLVGQTLHKSTKNNILYAALIWVARRTLNNKDYINRWKYGTYVNAEWKKWTEKNRYSMIQYVWSSSTGNLINGDRN